MIPKPIQIFERENMQIKINFNFILKFLKEFSIINYNIIKNIDKFLEILMFLLKSISIKKWSENIKINQSISIIDLAKSIIKNLPQEQMEESVHTMTNPSSNQAPQLDVEFNQSTFIHIIKKIFEFGIKHRWN